MKIIAIASAALLAAGGAVAQVAPQFDITGLWNSAGGGTIQIFQDNDDDGDITAVFVGPDFAHRYKGKYFSRTETHGQVLRVVRRADPPCSTKLNTKYSIQDVNTVYVVAITAQATCGFAKNQTLTDVLTRIY